MGKYLLPALLCLAPLSMQAFDVYFYKNATDGPVSTVVDAKELVFNEAGVTVVSKEDVSTDVAFAAADYFAFRNMTGVTNVDAAASTVVTYSGRVLSVVAAEPLRAVNVYGVSGAQVASFAVAGNDASCDLSSLAEGMYIVRVLTEKSSIVKKIIIAD